MAIPRCFKFFAMFIVLVTCFVEKPVKSVSDEEFKVGSIFVLTKQSLTQYCSIDSHVDLSCRN